MRFGRGEKRRPPAEIAARVSGRILIGGELRDGGWLVLSTAAVVVIGSGGQDLDRPWHLVDRGEWSSDGNHIRLTWVDGEDPVDLYLARDDRELAAVLREQVESSLVHAEVERLPSGAMLRGTIRRDANGELFSQVSVTGPVRQNEDLDRRARALESRVRAQVGLPA